jgi:hypothetical protein
MPKGSRPGERRGGRAKGTRNKAKANRELAIQIAGIEPKQFLLNGLAFFQKQIAAEQAKGDRADDKVIATAYAAGREYAKDAAPFCHARLSAVELAGKGGGPIETADRTEPSESARELVERRIAGLVARSGANANTPPDAKPSRLN